MVNRGLTDQHPGGGRVERVYRQVGRGNMETFAPSFEAPVGTDAMRWPRHTS